MPDLVNQRELARKLGMSRQTIWRLVKRGLICVHRFPGMRVGLYDADEVRRSMRNVKERASRRVL